MANGDAAVVRPARNVDRSELLRMRLALWPDSDPSELDEMMALPQSQALTLVADVGEGRLGGFAEFACRRFADGCATTPVAYLEGIWVDDDVRRTGVATELVREGEAWARGLGLSEMASDCEIRNVVSQGFHIGFGFEEVQRNISFRRSLTPGPRPGPVT